MRGLAEGPRTMQGSGIRQIMNLAFTMQDVCHVEVGEPDFPTPPHIVEAAHRAALEGYTRYTASAGMASLRDALAEKIRRDDGIAVSPDHITVTCGAVSGLLATLAALVNAGDEVLLPGPGWPNCDMMVQTLNAFPVFYDLDPRAGFLPDLDQVAAQIGPRTKAILINSPSNPTGAVFPTETVQGIMRLAERHDLWVISDEVYEKIVFDGVHVSPVRFDQDGRVIRVFSFSKTYAMTGWRVGYVVTPPPVTEIVNKLQEPFISCACSISQKAAEAAVLGPQDCVEEMRRAYHRRRDMVMGILRRDGMFTYIPRGAFYAMVDIARATDDTYAFARRLLLKRKVAVAPGEAFGPSGRGFIRVALCAHDDTIRHALSVIADEVTMQAAAV